MSTEKKHVFKWTKPEEREEAEKLNQERFELVEDRTWNNEGVIKRFEGTENECFEWIHKNTSFSFHEATTRQGYKLIKL